MSRTGQIVRTADGEVQLRWDDPSVQSDARLTTTTDGLQLKALSTSDFDFSALRLQRSADCAQRSAATLPQR